MVLLLLDAKMGFNCISAKYDGDSRMKLIIILVLLLSVFGMGKLVKAFNLGLLFAAQDADSLREAILRFISLQPEEIKVFKDNCRRFSEEFSMDNWAKNTLNVIEGET